MEDFLKKLQFSHFTIEIYLKSLGKSPLTYYELYSIIRNATPEEFEESLNELLNAGLFIQQVPKNPEMILQYLAIPPIIPILNYYENIKTSLAEIKNSIQLIMIDAINKIFENNQEIELDSVSIAFQENKKDIDEDTIIQKQEVEDIVKSMEDLNKINEFQSNFHQDVKSIMQTEFASLFKTITNLKSELIEKINSLDFKKHKDEIISVIENAFKEKLDEFTKNFVSNLLELIEVKFNGVKKKIEGTISSAFQYRNDFKMLLLNMLNNFETKMNIINDVLNEKRENLSADMKNLEINIAENLNSIIERSIDEVASLNKPVEDILNIYYQQIVNLNKLSKKDIWIINSVTKVNEEIQKLIVNTKENLIIIIPKLENHITIEEFKNLSGNVKIKLASSEPHTNSLVKNYKSINNLIYKNYENDYFIAIKSDKNFCLLGVIIESQDPLYDFIGIATNSELLVEKFDPIIQSSWEQGYLDTFYGAQKAVSSSLSSKPEIITPKVIKPIIPSKIIEQPVNLQERYVSPLNKPQQEMPEVPVTTPAPPQQVEKTNDLTIKLQEKVTFSSKGPKVGDNIGVLIDTAFNNLIQKLNSVKGDDFSKELQNIADLVLEKRGFSVTLHKLRSAINRYKNKSELLSDFDKKQILEEIQDWKQKLL